MSLIFCQMQTSGISTPSSVTDNTVVTFDGITGRKIKSAPNVTIGDTGLVTISQLDDSVGLKITGYDDKSGESCQLRIASDGVTELQASSNISVVAGSTRTLDLNFNGNIRVRDNVRLQFGTGTDYSIGYNSADDTLRIADGSDLTTTPRIVIDSSGKVGIGTDSPVNLLHVHNPGTGGSDHSYLHFTTGDTGALSTDGFTVGVTAGGIATLHMREDSNMKFFTNNTLRMTLSNVGILSLPEVYSHNMNGETIRDLQINDSGELGYDSSTERVKTNIVSMENTDWLYDLRPVNFEAKEKAATVEHMGIRADAYLDEGRGKKQYGLIAEEVKEVNPSFVFYDIKEDGSKVVAGVNYKALITPIINELQKLKQEVEQLKQAA